MNNPLYINEFFNDYINFKYSKNYQVLYICYPKYNWYTYGDSDCDMESITIKNNPYIINSHDPYLFLINLMRRKLSEGYYVLSFCDEYYISQKKRYHKVHNWHDFMLCGYNDVQKYFIGLGYTRDNQFKTYKIPFYELYQAIIWTEKNGLLNKDSSVAKIEFIKARKDKEYTIKPDVIKEQLENYIASKPIETDSYVYGIDAYYRFMNNLRNKFDIRCIRLIMEHKQIMLQRIEYLNKLCEIDLDAIYIKYQQIVTIAEIAFNTAQKYLLTNNEILIEKIINYLQNIINLEVPLINNLISKL